MTFLRFYILCHFCHRDSFGEDLTSLLNEHRHSMTDMDLHHVSFSSDLQYKYKELLRRYADLKKRNHLLTENLTVSDDQSGELEEQVNKAYF